MKFPSKLISPLSHQELNMKLINLEEIIESNYTKVIENIAPLPPHKLYEKCPLIHRYTSKLESNLFSDFFFFSLSLSTYFVFFV